MRFQVSLLQVIGLFLFYAAFGYLIPIISISLNPFEAAPLWIVASDLSVLLIGVVLVLLAGRFTSKLKPTRLQWLGVGVLSLVLFLGAYLLSSHGMLSLGAFGFGAIGGTVGVFGMQILSSRPQTSE
jgi:hypothetical protein